MLSPAGSPAPSVSTALPAALATAVATAKSVHRVRAPCGVSHGQYYQFYVDRTTPHPGARWTSTLTLLALFLLRIITYQGFYVVAYALGIYLLNVFLLFLSPRFDPASGDEDGLGNDAQLAPDAPPASILLPTRRDDEFRPFVRRLPEFRFWYNATWATLAALLATAFPPLDIPVFWPILLFYFVMLTFITLRRQITHMVRYKYVPFDFGKKRHYPKV